MEGAFDDLEATCDEDDNSSENLSENLEINKPVKNKCATFLLSNARSLMQKTDALTDAFESLQLDFACVTET